MANCPKCKTFLQTIRQREGIYFYCYDCHGRAVTLSQIRRMTGDRFTSGLVRKINTTTEASPRTCPFCFGSMKALQLAQPEMTLDSCRPCGAIWFDAGKFEELPDGVVESPDEVLLRGIEAEGKWKNEERRRLDEGTSEKTPEEGWKWIPAFIGLPVKVEKTESASRPWVTWAVTAIVTITSCWAFTDLKAAIHTFGFIPAEAWRYGGATFVTCFFIHAGFWHLLSNFYFFLLFGGSVEDYVGRWRFLGLIFFSTIVGGVFHYLFNLHSTEPCIGASGGISGVLVFYALEFPRAKLGFLFRYYWRFAWIHIPAWIAFILWLLIQLFGVYDQMKGVSNVSALAHVGGVMTGFVLWLWWHRVIGVKKLEPEEAE
jgi:membrane associated rhomboid family serine protease